jgi:regulator of ribonuclease activity A
VDAGLSHVVGSMTHRNSSDGTFRVSMSPCILWRRLESDLRNMNFKTADLCDEFSAEIQIVEPIFRHFGGLTRFAGPAATIKCFEDNSRVKEAVGETGQGRVLVVDGGGSMRCALVGDLLAKQAADNGWAGVVVYGCIRDSAEMAGFALGVVALTSIPLRSEKKGEGQREIAIQIPGVRVRPGDWVYADEDGLLVAPRQLI